VGSHRADPGPPNLTDRYEKHPRLVRASAVAPPRDRTEVNGGHSVHTAASTRPIPTMPVRVVPWASEAASSWRLTWRLTRLIAVWW